MKLEFGKYYLNRKGEKVGPLERTSSGDEGGFWVPEYGLFRSDGVFGYGDDCFCHDFDLICEWKDEPVKPERKLSGETIDLIAIDSLKWHIADEDMEPLQLEAFRIVLRYYGASV